MMSFTPQQSASLKTENPLMADIVAVREQLQAQPSSDASPSEAQNVIAGELSETFALMDPDLAALHKDMKTAAAQANLARKNGGKMAGIAQWRYESAQSAFETRLQEVRRNKFIRDHAAAALAGRAETKEQREARHFAAWLQAAHDDLGARPGTE